jgi:hypothetical protein
MKEFEDEVPDNVVLVFVFRGKLFFDPIKISVTACALVNSKCVLIGLKTSY